MNTKRTEGTYHLEETLQRAIDLIRKKIEEMARLDERALRSSLQAFTENNRQLAYTVILRDQHIDELEKELDRLCMEFFVRQQPVAGHLRFVYSTVIIIKELERIGDYAESIARQVLKLNSIDIQPPYEKFVQLADVSIPMFHDAVRAFVARDADLAKTTMSIEAKADQLRNDIDAHLMQMRQEGLLPVEALTPMMTIARRLERVADQAKNMCEEVLYISTGEYIKHRGTEVFRVLFLDQDNACRSQMAEGIGNSMGLAKFVFSSAGIAPRPLDSHTVRFMAEKGIDIAHHVSKSIKQVPNIEYYQVIVGLCKDAKKALPSPPSKPIFLDWEIERELNLEVPDEELRAALEESYQYLKSHIHDLVQAVLGDEISEIKEHDK